MNKNAGFSEQNFLVHFVTKLKKLKNENSKMIFKLKMYFKAYYVL